MVFDIWVIRDIFLSWRAIGPNWKGKHKFLHGAVTYRKCDSSSVINKKSGTETSTAPTSRRVLLLVSFFYVSFLSNQFSGDVFWLFHLLLHHLFLAKLHLAAYFFSKSKRMATLGQGRGPPTGNADRGVALYQMYQMYSALLWRMRFLKTEILFQWGIAVLCMEHQP